jgi:hypothetical protein
MEVSSALRRVKRQFGDEYNVVITDQDIYDWFYDAELDIIRATSDNDLSLQVPANKFPLQIPGRVNLKRLVVNNKALSYITVNELDSTQSFLSTEGTPGYWYFQGGRCGLWPAPKTTDVFIVDVTYSKTPAQMNVVAPYLQWANYGIAPVKLAHALVDSDDDWKGKQDLNLVADLAIDYIGDDVRIVTCSSDTSILAADTHWWLGYSFGLQAITLAVSNGTTFSQKHMHFITPLVASQRVKFRVTYRAFNDTATLYKIDSSTGVETLQEVAVGTNFSPTITPVAKLIFGAPQSTAVATTTMRLYGFEIRNYPDPSGKAYFIFNGEKDLASLYDTDTTFTTSSGHIATTVGGIMVYAENSFTVPEVYHEDIVKYALAKAHNKNMNFRAAEAEMDQYDQRVSTRRHEAQSIDGPVYKAPDPFDYSDY